MRIFNLFLFVVLLFGNLLFAKESEDVRSARIYNSLPNWIKMPQDIENYITAIGVAKKVKHRKMSYVRELAYLNGIDNLAKKVAVKVDNKFSKKIEFERKNLKNGDSKEAIKSYSKQVSSEFLKGVKVLKTYFAEDGNFYILVGVKRE